MSNYTPVILYAPKDSLAHGDPNKAIKGAQIDNELSAISSAISTKLDSPLVAPVVINGNANQTTVSIVGSATTGQSFGLNVTAGTTSADIALAVNNRASTPLFAVRGDGKVLYSGVDITPSNNNFTATFSGGGWGGSATIGYYKLGSLVFLYTNASYAGTAAIGAFTGLPGNLRPSTTSITVPFNGYFPQWGTYSNGGSANITPGGALGFGFGNSLPGGTTQFTLQAGSVFCTYYLS